MFHKLSQATSVSVHVVPGASVTSVAVSVAKVVVSADVASVSVESACFYRLVYYVVAQIDLRNDSLSNSINVLNIILPEMSSKQPFPQPSAA